MADIPVNDKTPRKQYIASPGQTIFPYDWPAFSDTHFKVQKTVAATGITSVLLLGTGYTVTGINTENGGNIVLVAGAAVNDVITISGNVPADRANDFPTSGDFFAAAVNADFDRAIMIIKQLIRDQVRSIRLLDEDTTVSLLLPLAALRASKFLAFDAQGNLVPAAGTSANLGPVSAFVNTLLDDADAVAFLATLGLTISAFSKTFLDDADAPTVRATLGFGSQIGVIDRKTATVDVVNTVAETDLYRFTVPGNTLGTQGKLRLTLMGDWLNNSGAPFSPRIRVKFDTALILDVGASGIVLSSGAGRAPFILQLDLDGGGATNIQQAIARLKGAITGAVDQTLGGGFGNYSVDGNSTFFGMAIDTTAAKDLVVTDQNSVANALISVRMRSARLELL